MRILLAILKWAFRLLAGLLIGFGALLAFLYPLVVEDEEGRQAGHWQVLAEDGSTETVSVILQAVDSPVQVYVYAGIAGGIETGADRVLARVTISRNGVPDRQADLTFSQWPPTPDEADPQVMLYRDHAGTLRPRRGALYTVEVAPAFGDGVDLRTIEVLVQAESQVYDDAVPPIGYGMLAIGIVGMAATFWRRRRRPDAPPAARWGRQ